MRKLIVLIAIAGFLVSLVGVAPAVPPGKTVEYEGGGDGKVVFDGKTHAAAGNKCNACHPKVFQMKKGGNTITMADINDGKFCGTCHNGEKTFDAKSKDNCGKCHVK